MTQTTEGTARVGRRSAPAGDPGCGRGSAALRAGAMLAGLLASCIATAPAAASGLDWIDNYPNGVGIGLNGAQSIAVSPDGNHVYAGGSLDNSVSVWSRSSTTGALAFVHALFNSPPGVDGLSTVRDLVVSPDGAHVYVAGNTSDAVAVFRRNAGTGVLTFVEAKKRNVGGITTLDGAHGVDVSPDGAHVYVVSQTDSAITVFTRDAATGALTLAQAIVDGNAGANFLGGAEAVSVSPDGAHVYVAAQNDNAVVVFSRAAATGFLTWIEDQRDGANGIVSLNMAQGLDVSADGAHVYVAAGGVDNALSVFRRNATTGALTFVEEKRDGSPGIDGIEGIEWVTVSPNGAVVYAVSDIEDTLVVFHRNVATGGLSPVEIHRDGVSGVVGLDGATMVAATPDGRHVYTANSTSDSVVAFGNLCGNGEFDPGEDCDDGNLANGDCCSAACLNEAAGTACADDGNLCTDDKCNGAGICLNVNNARPCDDGLYCTVNDACQNRMCTGAARDCSAAWGGADCHAGTCDETTDTCGDAPMADGTACDDANFCTQADTCQAGACTGTDPVVCVAADQCHAAGVCDPATGMCSDPNAANGTPCDDGDACTQTDTCMAGACVGANPVVCTALDQCHVVGVCDAITGLCSQPAKADGTACNDGNLCTQADTCQAGVCGGADPVVCVALDQCRVAGTCHPATGACSDPAKSDGTACDDGSICTRSDTCQAGVCTGADPIVCAAVDQCHAAGVCDPATGVCSDPSKPDGSACDDGDLCTQSDVCATGVCVGADPVTCTAIDDCHLAGTCDSATGACSMPAVEDGSACDDGSLCTGTDACQAGVCVGSDPVTCAALDQCHAAGVCDPATGVCSDPALPDGTTCDDASMCTRLDTCQGGICAGSDPIVCPAPNDCFQGMCDPTTGACTGSVMKPDGAPCDDGMLCTVAETCVAGACVGGQPVVCFALDGCHDVGTCAAETGSCSHPVKADGTTCDDGNLCTRVDGCQAGVCVGENPIACAAQDQCHDAGACDPASGECSHPAKADGTECDDADLCTRADTCQAGTCVGANPVSCLAGDACHQAGACDPATGVCSAPIAADGTACDDGDACTRTDSCQAGACVGADPIVCAALDQCHDAGVCDPATGICPHPAKPDGSACDDGNLCTQTDTCMAGACGGADPVICAASDDCHEAGACDPATGACSNPAKSDQSVLVFSADADTYTDADFPSTNFGTDASLRVDRSPRRYVYLRFTVSGIAGPIRSATVRLRTASDPSSGSDFGGMMYAVSSTTWDEMMVTHASRPEIDGGALGGAGIVAPSQIVDFNVSTGVTGAGTYSFALVSDSSNAAFYNAREALAGRPELRLTVDTTCDDADLCTGSSTCQGGVCVGAEPIVCTALDQCHDPGACDPATGVCSDPPAADGAGCDDGDFCTQTDGCQAGTCVGAEPIVCTALDQCHDVGACDPATGVCSDPPAGDGIGCDDGDLCTRADTCQAGVCAGADPVVCTALDQCHAAGSCDAATGTCSNPTKADGAGCDDGDLCTREDGCRAGVCVGADPVVCTAQDQCHVAGTCDAATGTCSSPTKADGVGCDDGDLCTQADSCQAGVCVGADPVVCTAQDQCHAAGTCDAATGTCSNPTKADGTGCDDGAFCTTSDICRAGVCGGAARDCGSAGGVCRDGVCDEAGDACVARSQPDGTGCDDGSGCTQTDVCRGGVCVGGAPVVCPGGDQCHAAGVCMPSTGACAVLPVADGTACDDGDACSGEDVCVDGICVGTALPDEDADGFCDLTDVCPTIPDPAQVDVDGDGHGDMCQCTAPIPGRCIAGGGSQTTDCLAEIMSPGPVTLNRKGTKVKSTLACQDGDPICDLDGARNGVCRFGIAVCFGNADPRLARCTAGAVRSVEVLSPRPNRGPAMDVGNAAALEQGFAAMGLEVRRGPQIVVPHSESVGDDQCTGLVELVMPAPLGTKPVRRKFQLRSTGASGKVDQDTFVLLCR